MTLQNSFIRLNNVIERLRIKIPGLPSTRVLLSAAGLISVALVFFVALQKFLKPSQPITTYTLPYIQNFDEVDLKHWFTDSGVWTLRTGTLLQTIGGEEAGQLHIPLKVPADAPYHASVFITLKKDSRNVGVSFNAQYPNLIAKQHIVYISRVNADTLQLVSGYVDPTGAFVTQAQVPLSVNTTEFRLDVYVYSNTYLVQVNGQNLIENRPLFYKNGMLGFYALGPAIFDTFKVTAAEDQNPGNMVYTSDFDQTPGGAGWVPISGTWQIISKQMTQSDATISDATIGYETSTFQNFTLQATFNQLSGQGAGVLFNMPSPYAINGSQVVRYSDETDSLIWGYYDEQGIFNRQGFAGVSPSGTAVHTLQIFSGDNSYDILLDDQMLARQVALHNTQGAVGLITSHASAGFTSVEVYPLFGTTNTPIQPAETQPTVAMTSTPIAATSMQTAVSTKAPPTNTATVQSVATSVHVIATTSPAATPLSGNAVQVVNGGDSPYQGVFTGKFSDSGWKILNGDWKFSDGNFVQTKMDGFDFATVYTKTAFKNFSIQIGLTHKEGSGAGLLFNLPFTDKLNGASMVRYSEKRDNAVIWGYFDENGVYKNQGYADVPHAGTDRHTLHIVGGDSSYSIYVDDKLIVQAVPYEIQHNSGYMGLITARTSAVYDQVLVDGVGAVFKGTYANMDGFTDQRIVSGKWTIANNKALQTVTAVSDYVWNTGVQASDYTITAKITLPNTSNAGGGFLIHMSQRGAKSNSYEIRLKDGGKAIWWGSINAEGKFKGQGSAPLTTTGRNFTLKLVVQADQIAIYVNDRLIVQNVQITAQDGWIGLLAYGGPVTFSDVKLDVNK